MRRERVAGRRDAAFFFFLGDDVRGFPEEEGRDVILRRSILNKYIKYGSCGTEIEKGTI